MASEERRGWWMVACLFLSLVLIYRARAGYAGSLLHPLLKEFGVQRAQLSLMSSLMFAGFGLAAPFSGWLVERIETRIVMTSGALLAGLTFIALSRLHSFTALVAAYCILGFGGGGASDAQPGRDGP
ncbi:MAG TPA: MFS transporter [Candidatus Binataceae bacterium]|nr:MFS transporter [Candidatus Binataceae bacterium]